MKKVIYILIILILISICFWLILTRDFSKSSQGLKKALNLESEQSEQIDIEAILNKNKDKSLGGEFKVGSAPDSYPKFVSGWINPMKPKIGDEQYISIKMRDPKGVKNVILEIQSRSGNTIIQTLTLELVEGSKEEGVWANVWQVHNVEKQFRAKLFAENEKGETDDLTYFIIVEE